MPDELKGQEATTAPTQPPGQPSVTVEPAVVEATPPPVVQPEPEPKVEDKPQSGKLVELHTSDFKKLKEKERSEGRKRAVADLNSRAIALGFSSLDEMFDSLSSSDTGVEDEVVDDDQVDDDEEEEDMPNTASKNKNKRKPANRRSSNSNSTSTKVSSRKARQLERENEKLRNEREKSKRRWKAEEKRRRDLQRKLDAKDVEMQLREQAVMAGVKDVDYALRLLSRRLSGKSEDELASFDESEFFTKLKEDKPYLFGEQIVPATTGNGGSDDPPAPSSDEVSKTVEPGHFDARQADPKDVSKRLRELGLDPNV